MLTLYNFWARIKIVVVVVVVVEAGVKTCFEELMRTMKLQTRLRETCFVETCLL